MPQKLFQWLVRGCQDKDSAGSGAEAKGAEATSATETIPVASEGHACPRKEEGVDKCLALGSNEVGTTCSKSHLG